MKEKVYKSPMVGYAYNHTRDMYKLYNLETKRVIVTREINGVGCKTTDPSKTMKMFCNYNEDYIVTDI